MFYDITMPLTPQIVVYPGDPPFRIDELMRISDGDICNLSFLSMASHTGTHIDVPRHFFEEGLTVDQIPPDYFIGKARVCEILAQSMITVTDLQERLIQKGEIILLKTQNSHLITSSEFQTHYTYLTTDAIQYLADRQIKVLGFDYLSVDSYQNNNYQGHKILLSNNIFIIEGLNLSAIKPGEYEMIGLPLNIKNGNGSPIRVLLRD